MGANWLKTIGPHIADYALLNLRFLHGNKFITIQGEVDHVPVQAHLHHIRRMVNTYSIVEVYTVKMVDPIAQAIPLSELLDDMEPKLALLLRNYASVFDTPTSLLPHRTQDHYIPLIKGSGPVKVMPYHYPHSQKEEIEKLVADMLIEGIIQPSKSPFLSPIILVKKKDGSWRVCTDYQALNAITIKDSFAIPTMDELFDELFGTFLFLKAGFAFQLSSSSVST